MKKGLFGVAAAAVLLALPASAANVTGTVYVTGTVTGTCGVGTIDGGSTLTPQTLDFTPLNGSDGKINPLWTGSTSKTASFSVVCNTGTPTIQITATQMGDNVPAAATFTSTVDYTATMTVDTDTGSGTATESVSYATATDTTPNSLQLSNPLTATADNVRVNVHDLNTDGGVLTAGSYGSQAGGTGGVINITITP